MVCGVSDAVTGKQRCREKCVDLKFVLGNVLKIVARIAKSGDTVKLLLMTFRKVCKNFFEYNSHGN